MTWSPKTHQWLARNPEPHSRGDRRTVGPVPLDQPDRLEASECFRVVEEAAVSVSHCAAFGARWANLAPPVAEDVSEQVLR